MAFEGDFLLRTLTQEIGARAALGLGGVGRKLHAVDGEHFSADQTLVIAQIQHLGEDPGDLIAQRSNERGDGCEVWSAVARQSNERDLLAAGTLDSSATDDPLRVGEQHHLEQHRGWPGRSPHFIVAVACVEQRQIDLVIEQMIQCKFKCSGE